MLGLKPWETWAMTPSELERFAWSHRRKEIKRRQDARYETAILASWIHNAAGPKVAKSPEQIYKQMEIKDPEADEEVTGPRRTYKGSLKSQFEQHIKWLEEEKKRDAGNS